MRAQGVKLIHRGQFMCYYEIYYSDEQGNEKTYEMVSKSGALKLGTPVLTLENIGKQECAVTVLVLNNEHNKMLLCKEFRLGVNSDIYSFTAGFIDNGETAEEAAVRELKEETGLTLTKVLAELPSTFTCAPVADDLSSLIICEAEGEITGSDSVYEKIESKWYTREELNNILYNKNIRWSSRAQAFVYMWVNGGII